VPLRPKLKPMDHWDMVVSFDGEKHRQEEEAFRKAGKGVSHARFKATLDGQMEEMRALRQQELDLKQQERDDMTAKVMENKRKDQAEEDIAQAKRDKMKKANDEMTTSLQLRRKKEQDRKQQEQDAMLRWLDSEKARKLEEERIQREVYARKCKEAREELEATHAEAERRKQAEQEEERAVAARQVKAMDKAEADNKAAVRARMEQIEKNCATLGADIAERDARAERELQEKVRRVQEESDRLSREDAEHRRAGHARKMSEMLEKLDEQMVERQQAQRVEKEANKRQAEIWRQQFEDGERKEREKMEKRKRDREELDVALITQVRESVAVHPRNYGMTRQSQQADLAYNRVLFEQMASEGFRNDVTGVMLGQARDRAKLDPFPSVGRFDGPIHHLEMQVPDS